MKYLRKKKKILPEELHENELRLFLLYHLSEVLHMRSKQM